MVDVKLVLCKAHLDFLPTHTAIGLPEKSLAALAAPPLAQHHAATTAVAAEMDHHDSALILPVCDVRNCFAEPGRTRTGHRQR